MDSSGTTTGRFFGASEIQSNSDLTVAKLVAGRGRLWGYCVDPTDDLSHGIYRIAQPADAVSTWYPTFITSDFAYEPAVKKRWGKLRIMSRYGGVSAVDYSVNSGETWTALSPSVSSSYGKLYYSDVDLAAIAASEHIRFRIKLTSTGDAGYAATYHRELVSFTVSFVMADTGKHAWAFTIIGGMEIETMDGELSEATTQAWDISDTRSTIWDWYDNKRSMTLNDVDGTTYDVQMTALTEIMPVVGSDVSGESAPEALPRAGSRPPAARGR